MNVRDKVVLITGASEGIGKATAELLAAKGANVALAARSKDKLEQVAAKLDGSFVVAVDMTVEDSITDMIAAVMDHYGRIDILINNAGQALRAPVTDIKVADFMKIMELNLYGPLRSMQAVIPLMKAAAGGIILNISSNVSKGDFPGIGAYAATKYALNGLTLTARRELAPDGIIVCLMHPGLTDTNFGANAIKNSEDGFNRPSNMHADSPQQVAEKILEAINNESAEQYMSEAYAQQFSRPLAGNRNLGRIMYANVRRHDLGIGYNGW